MEAQRKRITKVIENIFIIHRDDFGSWENWGTLNNLMLRF